MRSLTVTGTDVGGLHRGTDDGTEEGAVDGEGGPTALACHLAGRAAEIEIDVVDADLTDQASHGGPHHLGVDPAQLDAADGSSSPNAAMASVLALPSTRALAVIISLT